MTYTSRKPTGEKKRLFEFMERHKRGGVVSVKKVTAYAKKRGYSSTYVGTDRTASTGYGKKSPIRFYDIKDKNRRTIAEFGVKNKRSPRIAWWRIN